MKKKILISVLAIAILCLGDTSTLLAKSIPKEKLTTINKEAKHEFRYDNAVKIFDNFYINNDSMTPLFNENDKLIGFYFTSITGGYLIVDSFELNERVNVSIDDLNEPSEIDEISISEGKRGAVIRFPDSVKYENGSSTFQTSYYSLTLNAKKNITGRTRCFSYNTNGTCGSTACALLMYYYYDNINKNYITDKKYIGTSDSKQKALVSYFQNKMNDKGNGTGYGDLKKGLNAYLSSVDKSKDATYVDGHTNSTLKKIKERIDANRACIVGTSGDPLYEDHWVVGVGYLQYTGTTATGSSQLNFIKVNNGWYTTESKSIVYINYDYVDGVVYLK